MSGSKRVVSQGPRSLASPVIKHRLVPSFRAEAQDVGTTEILAAVLEAVPSS